MSYTAAGATSQPAWPAVVLAVSSDTSLHVLMLMELLFPYSTSESALSTLTSRGH